MTASDYVEIFRDKAFKWRWVKRAGNNRAIGTAGESFASKWGAKRAAVRSNPGVPIRVKGAK